MAVWAVVHEQTGRDCGTYKTKKAATAAADEAQAAHDEVKAQHNGEPVTFRVDKSDEPTPVEEPAEEAA